MAMYSPLTSWAGANNILPIKTMHMYLQLMQQLLPENKSTDAVLRIIRFQGYHSNKECTPFYQQHKNFIL
jgi:hypothetical protein